MVAQLARTAGITIEPSDGGSVLLCNDIDVALVEDTLGVSFNDPRLLITALTHPSCAVLSHTEGTLTSSPNSYARVEDNQRLEFLGDAVLELIVTHALFDKHTAANEGELTSLRQELVRKDTLYNAANTLGLAAFIRSPRADLDVLAGKSALADAYEAIIAAIYIDHGYDAAERFVRRTLNDFARPKKDNTHIANWKSALQEMTQAQGKLAPTYKTVATGGKPHDPTFTVEVCLDGKALARGDGKSKKEAEQKAAMAAHEQLSLSNGNLC
ncbi:ribonuclease 3 [Clostridia bacterium]|nr:ribonuclease 3 [Clostridia bacterium]